MNATPTYSPQDLEACLTDLKKFADRDLKGFYSKEVVYRALLNLGARHYFDDKDTVSTDLAEQRQDFLSLMEHIANKVSLPGPQQQSSR